ncbi:hypothetical protein U1707_08465 [Sphingomonas sp. PB2P12]
MDAGEATRTSASAAQTAPDAADTAAAQAVLHPDSEAWTIA